nr:MAG TPA: hypothetical protein [Caudoviricetes sp.]DAT38412.1 MAG TPA: hypothetical protein [Caudoviricetes sp.]
MYGSCNLQQSPYHKALLQVTRFIYVNRNIIIPYMKNANTRIYAYIGIFL